MNILFVAATSVELKSIKTKVQALKKKNMNISFLCSGVGNYNTVYSLTSFLTQNKVDFIVNIGVCGYLSQSLKSIQVGRVYNLHTKKELLVPIFFKFTDIHSITCSENVLYDKSLLTENQFVDMESFAVEFVSDKFRIPRILLKIPFDEIGKPNDTFDLARLNNLLISNIDYDLLLESIQKYIDTQIVAPNYDYIKDDNKMTFAEFEKLKPLISKYETLTNKSFRELWENNKSLSLLDIVILIEKSIKTM